MSNGKILKRTSNNDYQKNKPLYLDTSGKLVQKHDDTRIIWFSNRCTYWSDDWSKLEKTIDSIPVCPNCKSLGMQTTMRDWERSTKRYNDQVNDGFTQFIHWSKEKCVTDKSGKPIPIRVVFKKWLQNSKRNIGKQ